MFQWLFKYPVVTFSKGHLLFLSPWPAWLLWLSIALASAGCGAVLVLGSRRSGAKVRGWRGGIVWLLQSALAAIVLVLLWQPAVSVTELKPQQNIVAVVVDDSRSMALTDDGASREAQAIQALQGARASIERKFETRLYRLDRGVTRIKDLNELHADGSSTRIGDGLKQLVDETADLPVGAVVLLTDGADNSGGVDADTIAALRNRRIPIHAVGIGREHAARDVEIDDVSVAPRALADSRLSAAVRFHQHGYAGRPSRIVVRDGATVLAARDVTFGPDGSVQSMPVVFNAGASGAKALRFSLDPIAGEENSDNNELTRLVNVDSDQRRVLYIEGEPRWEYKFVRRAEENDRIVQLVTMLRTTENKIYRQNIGDPKELGEGFPTRPEDLFAYDAIVIGSIETNYFTAGQRELIREFVDRRGGGLLLLGGRFSLADGGWGTSDLAELLPVVLPAAKNTFHVEPATVELAPAGIDNNIMRLVDDPKVNADRWKKLPYLIDYQEPGVPKAGAAVLAMMNAQSRKMPMLVTENYGRGRTAVLATAGTWRWQMNLPAGDPTYGVFWQQLLRWLVAESPGHAVASVPNQVLMDEGHLTLAVDVRGADYQPVADARAEAHIIGPNGISARLEMTPVPDVPGRFKVDWSADQPGSYLTEVTAQRDQQTIGRDVLTFQRLDGVAESFHTDQNRELLERVASQTGGRYWKPQEVSNLADEISLSEAGITTRSTKDLWNMPVVFLALLLMRFVEWLLRRQWGIV
jgi:uncharacterized membrane protein